MASREWATFLPIPPPSTTDKVPSLDPGWCAAHGVNTGAEVVLRLLRDEVVPLIRSLKRLGLASYHFLIHDRHSGVPVATDGSYIHLRLSFKKPQVLDVGGKFEMTRPVDTTTQATVSGIDGTLLVGKDPQARMKTFTRLLELQSEWALALIEAHNWKDDADMVRQVLQFGHFLSNMLQMQFR